VPVPTPLHARTAALCTSLLYKDWAGCHAVRRYETWHGREYVALRHAAGLQDASPLYKHDVTGPGAAELLSRVTTRGVEDLAVGAVAYTAWCDGDGKVLDDGTVARLDDAHFRLTAAEPNRAWLERHARGLDVAIEDRSRTVAALALQGPRARDVLRGVIGAPADGLGFFRALHARAAGHDVVVTRTGYTGDLGYELWVANEGAVDVWDALVEAGRPHGLLPTGLDALDVARVEAGFVLLGVDYFSARTALIDAHRSSPYEIGLGWTVKLDRGPFVGQAALAAERERGPRRRLAGVEIDWATYEALHERYGLPPDLPAATCREGVPLWKDGRQVGQVTSRAWSPLLKSYLGLATLAAPHAAAGTELEVEVTIEYRRHRCPARVVRKPFFDPERKRS
jgi:glycine cleavage system T protein (aminomethyltransferase)